MGMCTSSSSNGTVLLAVLVAWLSKLTRPGRRVTPMMIVELQLDVLFVIQVLAKLQCRRRGPGADASGTDDSTLAKVKRRLRLL
jgi:hypothetical protein